MPSDAPPDEPFAVPDHGSVATGPGDVGLLSPVSIGAGDAASDRVVVAHLIDAELALTRALVAQGLAPASAGSAVDAVRLAPPEIDLAQLAQDSVSGGNPVIPLIPLIRARVADEDPDAAAWVHTRRDEPGHPRLRADDARPRRGGVGRRRTSARRAGDRGARSRSPRRPRGGPHAHPARRADDPRPEGGDLAARDRPRSPPSLRRRRAAARTARRSRWNARVVRRALRGRRSRGPAGAVRRRARSAGARRALAHGPLAGHRTRRCARRGRRRDRDVRLRRREHGAHRGRRGLGRCGRRIQRHAAEAESGGCRPPPLRRAARARTRGSAAPRGRAGSGRAAGRRVARGVAGAAGAAAARSRRVRPRRGARSRALARLRTGSREPRPHRRAHRQRAPRPRARAADRQGPVRRI